ncbi:MAG: ATP-binding protein [Planctomycetes bacterium]|nr:ATP-binding protein [Planctomycetota bacterium]
MSSLSKGEGMRVEFKRVLPRDERAARTLCAFANTRGGLLLVGVTDRGRVHGLHRPDEVQARLDELARRWIEPALDIRVQVVDVHGPRVVACSVPFSRIRPHALLLGTGERQFLVRVGASNRIADGPTLTALRLSRRNRRGLSKLEETILEWVRRHGPTPKLPGGTATIARFARLHNLSEARARRLFIKLEGLGLLVGHGAGRARIFNAI